MSASSLTLIPSKPQLPWFQFPRRLGVWAGVSITLFSFLARILHIIGSNTSTIEGQARAYIVELYMSFAGGAIWSTLPPVSFVAFLCIVVFLLTAFCPLLQHKTWAKWSIGVYWLLTFFVLWGESWFTIMSWKGFATEFGEEVVQHLIGKAIPPIGVMLFLLNPMATLFWCFWGWIILRGIEQEFSANDKKWFPSGTPRDWSEARSLLKKCGQFLLVAVSTQIAIAIALKLTSSLIAQLAGEGSALLHLLHALSFPIMILTHFVAVTFLMIRWDASLSTTKSKIGKWLIAICVYYFLFLSAVFVILHMTGDI